MNDRRVFVLFLDTMLDADAAARALMSFEVVAEDFAAEQAKAAAAASEGADGAGADVGAPTELPPLFAYALHNDEVGAVFRACVVALRRPGDVCRPGRCTNLSRHQQSVQGCLVLMCTPPCPACSGACARGCCGVANVCPST